MWLTDNQTRPILPEFSLNGDLMLLIFIIAPKLFYALVLYPFQDYNVP